MTNMEWNAPLDNGDLDNDANYAGASKAGASDNLVFNTRSDRSVTANLNAYAAVALGEIVVNRFVGSIGAGDEWLVFESADAIKYAGRGQQAYFSGDVTQAVVYDTGAGVLHLRSDGGGMPDEEISALYARGGRTRVMVGAANNTRIDDIHVWPGAMVTIDEDVNHTGDVIFHGGGAVVDHAGGSGQVIGHGGRYELAGSAARTNTPPHEIGDGMVFDHRSSGAGGPIDIDSGGALVTVFNDRSGTLGAVRIFDGGASDLDQPGSGVSAASVTRIPDLIVPS